MFYLRRGDIEQGRNRGIETELEGQKVKDRGGKTEGERQREGEGQRERDTFRVGVCPLGCGEINYFSHISEDIYPSLSAR